MGCFNFVLAVENWVNSVHSRLGCNILADIDAIRKDDIELV